MSRPIVFLACALVALAASSAPAQPAAGPAGDERLDETRRLIAASGRLYGPRAAIEPAVVGWLGPGSLPSLAGAGAVLSGDRLYLAREALGGPHRDVLVAAAVAYRLVEKPLGATTLAGYEQELREWAREGNAKTVEVLERVKGMSEEGAVDAVARWILAQHAAAPDRHTAAMLCEEVRDLAARFPRQRVAVPVAVCAEPGGPGARPTQAAPGAVVALLVTVAPLPPAEPAPPAASRPTDQPASAAPAPAGGPGPEVPPAYCTPGHRLRYVYRCPAQ